LEKNRKIKGNLDFDFPETKIVLDDNKNVIKIMQYPRYESNKMIELFMVSANHSISKMFSNLPFLHRIHPEPNKDDIEKLQ
jgi:ribonuclease R